MKLVVLKNHVPTAEVWVETIDPSERYEIFVGRAEDCHLRIDDPLISRHHFVLLREDDTWYCEKLTTLGTVSLNGALITKAPIKSGDELKCGLYSVIVSDLLPPSAVAAKPLPEIPPRVEAATSEVPEKEPLKDVPDLEAESDLDGDDFLGSSDTEVPGEQDELGSDQTGPDEPSSGFDFDQDSFDVAPEESALPPNDAPADVFGDSGEGADDFGGEVAEFGGGDLVGENESTQLFKTFVKHQLALFGEHAPYDRYLIEGDDVFIGRDSNKCQIVLDDPEVSSVHAVIKKNNAELTLEDLNSSNGTILNGARINKSLINTGDEFVIGSTSFTLEVRSDLLDTEGQRLMPVEEGQVIEREEIEEVEVSLEESDDFATSEQEEKSIVKRILKNPEKRKRALIILVLIFGAWILLEEDAPEAPAPVTTTAPEEKPAVAEKKLDPALEQKRNTAYQLGIDYFEQNRYSEAEEQFMVVSSIDPKYKQVETYLEQTRIGLKRLQELEAQKRAEEERLKLKKEVEELLVKARKAVKERSVPLAQDFFSKIVAKDPENIEVQQLKLELEAWQRDEERKALEQAAKDAARKAMVDALQPGKTYYLKKEWYHSIGNLEKFLRKKGMDEDLVKEASEMLSDAKSRLASEIGPLLGKARSFKEGQDFKNAYEAYLEVLKVDPTQPEALNEIDEIRGQLENRSKRIYREAIISESLSLFSDAKEKFQEVQQISPTDSEYYKKASEKLKNYLE